MNKLLIMMLSVVFFMSCNKLNNHKEIVDADQHEIDFEQEKKSIIEVIQLENNAYRQKDYETWKSTYVQKDYLKNWGYYEGYQEKVIQYNSWEDLSTRKQEKFKGEVKTLKDETTKEIRDLTIQIRNDIAWITYKQINLDKETKKINSESLETRILEKINGNWKIAYVNFLYFPKE